MPKEPDPNEVAALRAMFDAELKAGAEQFRAQLIKLIDERIALAAQSAVRSGVAYRLHGEPSGMHDPRG